MRRNYPLFLSFLVVLGTSAGHASFGDPQIPLVYPPTVSQHAGKCAWSSMQGVQRVGMHHETSVPPPPLEVQPLVNSGASSNRVDLVFFSDGYTTEEHEKFITDATRLAEDISGNQTFSTVKPLLNFWAAFSPSKETGIGSGGTPKDTPFGLYRDGTELRGVYYSKPEVAEAACSSMGDQCDYPILLGNDPYYGGLGGEFTVITSSLANGPLVLRHELGHSIIEVGEEYDGGFAYFGPNAAHDLSEPIPWAHWLSSPLHSGGSTRVERSVMPMQEYPWTLLDPAASWSVEFVSSGQYSRHIVRFSLSGMPEKTDLKVELDGEDLGWVPHADIGLDRWHYDIFRDGGLSPGRHEVKFTLMNKERQGIAQLCSVEILEFGNEEEFISTPGHYSLFPTYSDTNETSFRPTNEDCLMRVVTSPNFCRVCIEGLWLSLFRRVSLIDQSSLKCEDTSALMEIQLLPLAQFRTQPAVAQASESYTIVWSTNGEVLTSYTNQTRLEVHGGNQKGRYEVDVQFSTEEVRVDREGILKSHHEFDLAVECAQVVST